MSRSKEIAEYWQKVHALEVTISEPSAVVISLATPQGGKAGVFNEADRRTAARLVVEKQVVLATPEQARAFRESVRAACEAENTRQAELAEAAEAVRRLQYQVRESR